MRSATMTVVFVLWMLLVAVAIAQMPTAARAQAPDAQNPATQAPATAEETAETRPPQAESWLPQSGRHLAELARSCRAERPATPPAMRNCYGFQAGVAVSALFFARQAGVAAPFCLPDGTTDAEITQAITAFVAATPGAADYPAVGVIVAALVESFPCPDAN